MKKGGALSSVATELIASASEVAAYPDSDDDESDDDEDVQRATRSFSVSKQKVRGSVFIKKQTIEEGIISHTFAVT